MNRIHADGTEGMEESFGRLSQKYLKPVFLQEELRNGKEESQRMAES